MAGISNYYLDEILDALLQGDAVVRPATEFYVALLDTVPTAASTGTTISEVEYDNYTRAALSMTTGFADAADGVVSNAIAVTFPLVGTTGDDATHWAICDAFEDGNLYYWGAVTSSPITLAENDVPIIQIGALTITLA